MSALPEKAVAFSLPKRKPRVMQKEAPPDQRKVVVLPIRAVFDQKLTHGALQALAALCAYCNRAGITWVSQTRLAKELGISQQAVAKQFKQLREHGYLETIRRGFKGDRTDTLRVIFDKTVDAATAIAVTSSIEDTRPPVIQKEQAMETEKPDPQGQKRVAQAIAQVLKQPMKERKTMPKDGQTRAVKAIKEANQKGLQRRSGKTSSHNSQVVNEEVVEAAQKSIHSQPNHNLQVVSNTENTVSIDSNKSKSSNNLNTVFNSQEVIELVNAGVREADIADHLETVLEAYRAEGLTPKSSHLVAAILQLHRDVR